VLIAPLGVYQLLLVAAAILVLSLSVTNLVDSRSRREARPVAKARTAPDAPIGRSGAFQLLRSSRYLLGIAFLMLLLNWVNTNGEYLLGRIVKSAASEAVAAGTSGGLSEREYIGRFYSRFFSAINLIGLVAQLFLVSRAFRYLGVRWSLLVLPAIAVGGYALIAFYPVLSAVRWTKTAENATDYSLNNTVRNALFLPTSREEKYKAKQAIDTFFVRTGDVLSSGLVFLASSVLLLGTRDLALVNLALAGAWILLAAWVGRRYLVLARAAATVTEEQLATRNA
jgi:ATP:ADP antiporter, AAA family